MEIIWKIFQDPKRKCSVVVEEAVTSDSSDEIIQFARQKRQIQHLKENPQITKKLLIRLNKRRRLHRQQ